MRKAIGLILLACCAAVAALAQPPTTAKYLWIETVQLNTGKHLQFQDMVRQVRAEAKETAPGLRWVAATPLTGDGRTVKILIPHKSVGDIDQTLQAMMKIEQAVMAKNVNLASQAAETESGANFALLKFRDDLSYKLERVNWAVAARWKTTTFYLKPGEESEFADLIKQFIELENRVGDPNAKWTTYELLAGGTLPAYVIVEPLTSLADLDAEPTPTSKQVYNATVMNAWENGLKTCVSKIESDILMVRPDLSHPPENMLAANPDFWTVKEPAAAASLPMGKKKGKMQEAELKSPPKK